MSSLLGKSESRSLALNTNVFFTPLPCVKNLHAVVIMQWKVWLVCFN